MLERTGGLVPNDINRGFLGEQGWHVLVVALTVKKGDSPGRVHVLREPWQLQRKCQTEP